jgi:hypothetical protein
MTSIAEHDEYTYITPQKTQFSYDETILIDCMSVIKDTAYNMMLKKNACDLILQNNKNARMIFVMTKNIDNTNIIRKRLNELAQLLRNEFGDNFYACVLLHKDGYYRFPYDGFKIVCDKLNVKSVDRFITITKAQHYDTFMKGCYNYNIKELCTLSDRNTTIQHIDTLNQQSIIRFSLCTDIDTIIRNINMLKRHLILLIGPPNVGKTTFAERLNGTKMRYIRTLIPNKKVRDNVSIYLDEKDDFNDDNLIIDGEHATEKDRYMFIKACQMKHIPCVSVLFDVTKAECKFLNSYLFNKSKGENVKTPANGITRFYTRYQHPRICEDITNVIKISGIPCNCDDKLY